MSRSTYFAIEKSGFSISTVLILTLSLIFLQEGFTYYVSVQMLALVTIAILIFSSAHAIKDKAHFLVAFLVFTFSVAITAVVSPTVISRNSSNISVTVIGILGYALMIGCLPHLKIKRATLILHVLRSVASATIYALAGLIVLSESKFIPFLTRESLLKQNSRLIDNLSSADDLSADLAYRLLIDQAGRIDLFYGEPSFLAIVLFTCLGCFILTSKLLTDTSNGDKYTYLQSSSRAHESIILIGIISLLYIESLSSIIYALIVIYFTFIKRNVRRMKFFKSIPFLVVIGVVFLIFSYEYLLYRVTQADSLSLIQRFGFLSDTGIDSLLFGIKDESKLPDVGIHNGLFYIIAISGFGGILYLASLLYSVYTLSFPIKSHFFLVLLVLAIMMQNGGVFSPSKVVLFSLVLLPLACARAIYSGRHPTVIDGR